MQRLGVSLQIRTPGAYSCSKQKVNVSIDSIWEIHGIHKESKATSTGGLFIGLLNICAPQVGFENYSSWVKQTNTSSLGGRRLAWNVRESSSSLFPGPSSCVPRFGRLFVWIATNCVDRYWQALMKLCSSEDWEPDPFNNTQFTATSTRKNLPPISSLFAPSIGDLGHCFIDESNYVFIIVFAKPLSARHSPLPSSSSSSSISTAASQMWTRLCGPLSNIQICSSPFTS